MPMRYDYKYRYITYQPNIYTGIGTTQLTTCIIIFDSII